MTSTVTRPRWVDALAPAFADLGAQVHTSHQGDHYVSIPTGYSEAIEIEFVDADFQVWLFRWDRTGGVALEREIYCGSALGLTAIVREAYVARQAELGREDGR